MARAFDVTPYQALVLTSQLLNRESVVRVQADPEGRAGEHPNEQRPRRVGHERRPALHHHGTPSRRTTHHRFGDRSTGRGNWPGRPRNRRPRPGPASPSRRRTGQRCAGPSHIRQRLRPGDWPGRHGEADPARCRPGRVEGGGLQGHRHRRGGVDGRRSRGRHRDPELVADPAPGRT